MKMDSIYDKIVELRKDRINAILCTIISSKGSTPRKHGSKMIVTHDSKIYGTIGGGTLEYTVVSKASELMNSSVPLFISYNLSKDLGMVCGGSVDVFFEPISQKFKLFIFGAGHIGKSLARIASTLDFDIHVIDDRDDIFDNWEKNEVTLVNNTGEFIKANPADENTFIVIVTPSHASDVTLLKEYVNQNFAFCGVIGSKKKAAEIRKTFISESFATEEEFERINLPIGMEIGAEGPEEIAISIAAKLILEKSKLITE